MGEHWVTENCTHNITCVDEENQIQSVTLGCAENATCQMIGGGYTCKCDGGYFGNGFEECDPIGCTDENGNDRSVSFS